MLLLFCVLKGIRNIILNIIIEYNRKESLEISGIPEHIKKERLEEYIVYILRQIGFPNVRPTSYLCVS